MRYVPGSAWYRLPCRFRWKCHATWDIAEPPAVSAMEVANKGRDGAVDVGDAHVEIFKILVAAQTVAVRGVR